MKALVLDASVTLGWMFDEPKPGGAVRAQRRILAGEVAVVPGLWLQEVSNAVVMAERRGRLAAEQVVTLAVALEEFAQAVEIDRAVVRATILIEMARRASLTAYDAVYLELALRRKLPLATLDDKLRDAARLAGVRVV